MIPEDSTPTQDANCPHATRRTTTPPAPLVRWPTPDAAPGPAPETCPCCGRPYSLFHHDTSAMVDMVLLAQDVLADLKAALEEETLP